MTGTDTLVLRDNRGRFLKPPPNAAPAITSDKAREFAQMKRDRKQQAVQQAANEAVEDNQLKASYGDMAFTAAIARTAMQKATTPDDPKAIDAARFLLQETGLAEPKQAQEAGPVREALDSIVLSLLAEYMQQRGSVVEGDIVNS